MEQFLKKIKFITEFDTEIELNLNDFINKLSKIVEKPELGMFSKSFEIFCSNPEIYKGTVEHNNFKIRRKKKIFDTFINFSIAEGTYLEENGIITIKTKIFYPKSMYLPTFIFMPVLYFLIVFGIIYSGKSESLKIIPYIFLHAIFLFSLTYFIAKISVIKMKIELQSQFKYLTKK